MYYREITPTINYGPLRCGHPYRLIEKGYDYYVLSAHGRPLYVPFFVFRTDKYNGWLKNPNEFSDDIESDSEISLENYSNSVS